MAWYEITRKCGHTEGVQIRGTNVHGERERRAEREAQRLCVDCYRAERETQRAQAAVVATASALTEGLPPLEGSPKQIAWAETIRRDALEALTARMEGLARRYPDEVEQLAKQGSILRRVLLRQVECRWWIDHRDVAKYPMPEVKRLLSVSDRALLGSKVSDEAISRAADRAAAQAEQEGLRHHVATQLRAKLDGAAEASREQTACRHGVPYTDDCPDCEL